MPRPGVEHFLGEVGANSSFSGDLALVILDTTLELPPGQLPSEESLNDLILEIGASQQTFSNARYGQSGIDTGGDLPIPVYPVPSASRGNATTRVAIS